MASQSAPKNVPWIAHAASQLKFVLPGALATYYLNVLEEYWNTLSGPSSLGRCALSAWSPLLMFVDVKECIGQSLLLLVDWV